jgi:hypothetical protein
MRHPHMDPEWMEARHSKWRKQTVDPEIERLEKEKRILLLKKEIKQLQEELEEDGHAE